MMLYLPSLRDGCVKRCVNNASVPRRSRRSGCARSEKYISEESTKGGQRPSVGALHVRYELVDPQRQNVYCRIPTRVLVTPLFT